MGDGTYVYRPIYDTNANGKIYSDNAVVGVTLDGKFTARAEHDNLGRVVEKTLTLNGAENPLISESISYLSVVGGANTRLTNMVESFTNKVNGTTVDSLFYVYDNNGNIVEIKRNNEVLIQYAYDGLNQLVREDNAILGKITTFTYDTAGNITEKKVHNRTALGVGVLEQTIPYTYATTGWKDRLVSYNGQSITYDALGNPTSYRGHNLVWGKVKQLQAYDTNTFTYNAEGIRTSKNNITYELDGTKILREVRGANVIEYFYDTDTIVGFRYNNVDYYYQKNQQSDITAIYTASGVKEAEYVYDAWGKCTVLLDTNGIATINPFRYRGYYYDTETGLYYLQSRYYDPEVGRFINADSQFDDGIGLLGYAMFTYCGNNPVYYIDFLGTSSLTRDLRTDLFQANLLGGAMGGIVIVGSGIVIGWSLKNLVSKLIDSIRSALKTESEANIEENLTDIAGKYKDFECVQAAAEMAEFLEKNNEEYERVCLIFPLAPGGVVWSLKDIYKQISQNGMHYGILYQGQVYCNVYPEGLAVTNWRISFFDLMNNLGIFKCL